MIEVHGIVDGPTHVADLPTEDWPPQEIIDADQLWFVEADVSFDEDRFVGQLWFKDFDKAYDLIKSEFPVFIDDQGNF